MSELLTPADLAERFSLTEEKVLELRRKHDWPHVRLGRRFRFTEAQYQAIVDAETVAAVGNTSRSTGLTARSAARKKAS